MKVPPPFSTACRGKRKKLPRPTALPAMARISPMRDPQRAREVSSVKEPPLRSFGERTADRGKEHGKGRRAALRRVLHGPGPPSAYGVVRCFPGDGHVVGVRLAQPRRGDAHELG